MSQPLVSVILPAYNGAATLETTLASIFAQTYPAVEILAIDDASTDTTWDVLQRYRDRIHAVRRETNSGICDRARCDAIERARGTYCALIDQDDLWTPDKLERQVAFMETHPEYPLSHTSVRIIDEHGNEGGIRHEGAIPASGPCARELLDHCFITISSIMVRPEVWLAAQHAHGMVHANTDIETFLHIHREHPAGFGFLPEVLGSYRRWSGSMSRQDWRWSPKDVNELERVYQTGCWQGVLPEAEVRKALARAYAVNADHHDQQGWPGRALHFVRRGLRYAPRNPALYRVGARTLARGLVGAGFATARPSKGEGHHASC